MYSKQLKNMAEEYARKARCSLILMTSPPAAEKLTSLNINSNLAYVRVINIETQTNTLFYINIATTSCVDLSLSSEILERIDNELNPVEQAIILSKEALDKMTSITNHNRRPLSKASESVSAVVIDPNDAILHALQIGNDKYIQFVTFLLDDSKDYRSQYNMIENLKKERLSDLLVLKSRWATFSAVKNIAEESKLFLNEARHDNESAYQAAFLDRIQNLQPHLMTNLNYHLDAIGVTGIQRSICVEQFKIALHSCLPQMVSDMPPGFVHDISDSNREELLQKLDRDIDLFSEAECSTKEQYDEIILPFSENEEAIRNCRQNVLRSKASELMTKGLIPAKYQKLTSNDWAKIAGTVNPNYIDRRTKSNLALFALEYNNISTFNACFRLCQGIELTHQNTKKLTANDYREAYLSTKIFFITPEPALKARDAIEKVDFVGQLLRPIVAACCAYLDEWEKTNLFFSKTSWRSEESFSATVLDTLFSSRTNFRNSKQFVEQVLEITQLAIEEQEPIDFHPRMKRLLSEYRPMISTITSLNGGGLYADVMAALKRIEGKSLFVSDEKYQCLKIPSIELVTRMRSLQQDVADTQTLNKEETIRHNLEKESLKKRNCALESSYQILERNYQTLERNYQTLERNYQTLEGEHQLVCEQFDKQIEDLSNDYERDIDVLRGLLSEAQFELSRVKQKDGNSSFVSPSFSFFGH